MPTTLKLRFVRVVLNTGEVEVLVTSLLDERKYPDAEFQELYHERWQIETFYHILKSRLCLENFTGKTVEAVRQDFHSTLYISALESALTEDAEHLLEKKKNTHTQKVNKAISFHVIKNKAFEIVAQKNKTSEEMLGELTELFQQNPTLVRSQRIKKRKKRNRNSHAWASIHFQRNIKKQIF